MRECRELSWKHNCTMECTVGIQMAATHSLLVVSEHVYTLYTRCKSAEIHRFKLIQNKTLNFLMITRNINQETCAVSGSYTYMIGFSSFVHDRHVEDSTSTKQWWIQQSHTRSTYVISIDSCWELSLIPLCLRLKRHIWSTRIKRSAILYEHCASVTNQIWSLPLLQQSTVSWEGGRRLVLRHPIWQWNLITDLFSVKVGCLNSHSSSNKLLKASCLLKCY